MGFDWDAGFINLIELLISAIIAFGILIPVLLLLDHARPKTAWAILGFGLMLMAFVLGGLS